MITTPDLGPGALLLAIANGEDDRLSTRKWNPGEIDRLTGGDGLTRVTDGVLVLKVRDMLPADLASCGWSGSALHLESVARELDRARAGEVEYLAVCPASGVPVGIGGVDYGKRERAGYLWQLVVHPVLRSCGIGSLLVVALEARIRARGLRRAELSVEEDNPRARVLYERLGYVAYGREPDGWDELGADGSARRYETVCTLMRKQLGDSVPKER